MGELTLARRLSKKIHYIKSAAHTHFSIYKDAEQQGINIPDANCRRVDIWRDRRYEDAAQQRVHGPLGGVRFFWKPQLLRARRNLKRIRPSSRVCEGKLTVDETAVIHSVEGCTTRSGREDVGSTSAAGSGRVWNDV